MKGLSGAGRVVRALGAAATSALLACGHAPEPKPPAPPASPLRLSPLADLAPAASLGWLVDVRPRALALDGRLAGALARVFPEEGLRGFARVSGGVDLRETDELVVASYPSTQLLLAHQFIEPARIEAAFRARVVSIEGQAVEGASADPRSSIVRLWGPTGTEREQLAIFGFDGVGLERGTFGPLRAAELFAQGKLKRASPALRAPPLSRLAELLGDAAPLRAFAPGPFEGELKHAAGGLLGASTAVGGAARVVENPRGGASVAIHAVWLGAWGADPAAATRLRAVFDLVAASGVGRLFGLSHCLAGPSVASSTEALTLDFTVDATVLAEGLHAATGAEVSEIMAP